MTPTVHALRNEIRVSVGRFERPESTGFTKESLAAICEALDAGVETDPIPAKSVMRAGIRRAIVEGDGEVPEDGEVPDDGDRPLRKAELQAIAEALREE